MADANLGSYCGKLYFSKCRERCDGFLGFEGFNDLSLIDGPDEAIGESVNLYFGLAPGDSVAGWEQLIEAAI
ncbi:MAG: hypothetical protein A3K15_05365 [Candidatus Edwardsbacteria bacterium GWE2_54_12]|nr:MAG: hypothetical protein A3K15_05365 [Candidatus Edwardsbacteria bacterium GWE2_54_12]